MNHHLYSPKPMHFIPIVNHVAKLLPAALEGCKAVWPHTLIIDNRHEENELAVNLPDLLPDSMDIGWLPNSTPMTTAQTMNLMLRFAQARNAPWFTWQHLDAVCEGDTAVKLREIAQQHMDSGTKWGMIHTNYDTYAACNVAALVEVGGWDWLRFPFYFLDNDIHHRLELAGYQIIKTGLPVKHIASQTIQDGGIRQLVHEPYFEMSKKFFVQKWPGVSYG